MTSRSGGAAALRAGPEPIPRRRLAAERVGQAIETGVNDEGMRRRAAEIGMWIQVKDGVVRAVGMVAQMEAGGYA